jgi:hypothetical protein
MFTLVELAIAFAVGFGTRELISRRRRAAERKAYFERRQLKAEQALYDYGDADLVPRP